MSSPLRVYEDHDYEWLRPDRETRHRAPAPPDSAGVLDRRPLALSSRELIPMAAILMMVAAIAALFVIYLTAFARLSAHGSQARELDRKISSLERDNRGLAGEVERLQRRDRVELEARRLGLVRVRPDDTDRLELPAGALDEGDQAAADGPVRMSRRPPAWGEIEPSRP